MIAPVIGRKLSPVSIGVKPSTCCRYSETKYHIANTEQPSRKTTRLAAVSVRERKIPSGTSGRGARRSMKTKSDEQREAGRGDLERRGRRPAVDVGAHDGEGQQHEAGGDAQRARRRRSGARPRPRACSPG